MGRTRVWVATVEKDIIHGCECDRACMLTRECEFVRACVSGCMGVVEEGGRGYEEK